MTHLSHAGAARYRRHGHNPLLSPLLAFVVVALGAMTFIGYILWPRWPGVPVSLDAPALPVVIAGTNFNVPPAAVRRPMQRRPGVYDRIDLAFLWPSLLPPDPALKPTPENPIDPNERLFVSIASGETTFPMAERVRTIYPRYLEQTSAALDNGLTLQPFRDGTPYQGEDLIVNADLSFSARCSRQGVPAPGSLTGKSGICLYERRFGDADVTVRFPRDWLSDTPGVIAGLERLFAMIAPHRK